MTRGPSTIEINLPAHVSRLTLTPEHNFRDGSTAKIAPLSQLREDPFSIFHDLSKLARSFGAQDNSERMWSQQRWFTVYKAPLTGYDSDRSRHYFEKSMRTSLCEKKRSGRSVAAAAASAPPFVPTNRANYVSLAEPPRTGNETLPEVPLSVPSIRLYVKGYVHIHASDTPIYVHIPARLRARSGNAVGLSPAEGIRYDDGDNLRLYPRAGQRFN